MTDQTPQQSDKLEINEKTYPIGTVLERPGKTAKVLGISKKDRVFKGCHCLFVTTAADGTVREQQGLLSIRDLEVPPSRGGWKPRKVEIIPVELDGGLIVNLDVAAPTDEPTAPVAQHVVTPVDIKGQIEAFLSAIGIVSFFDVKKTADGEPGEWMFTTNLMTPGAVERRLSEAGSPSFHVEDNEYQGQRAWSAKAWFVPPTVAQVITVDIAPDVDPDLTATAELIRDLRSQIALKDAEIERLTESPDSAINHDVAAADRHAERAEIEREQINLAHERFNALHEQGAQKYGTAWLIANMQVNHFAHQEYVPEDMYGETDIRVKALLTETAMVVAALNGEIATLTEQLAEARAASAPIIAVPATDVLAAPVKEFKIVNDARDADLCRMEKEGWQVQHMQFLGNTQYSDVVDLHVVYFRICRPAPAEPARKATTSVGSTLTIQVIEQQPVAAPMPPAELTALPVNERKAAYADIIARRDISWAEKRALLNDHLVAVGAQSYQAASVALAQPVRSLVEIAHD